MGSEQFNTCWIVSEAGYGDPPFQTEAGAGPTIVNCLYTYTGRRPRALVDECPPETLTIGDALAHAAYLEAASVAAFRDLACQLEAHAAPASLLRRLRSAADDEVRHARAMSALARRRGGTPRPVRVPRTRRRPLLAIALENATEGCVRETWGAVCAVVQSLRARDPELRAAMRGIARDELRHAELSWHLGAWLGARLTEEERALVDLERAGAVRALARELDVTPREAWHAQLGFPTREETRAMLRALGAGVWKTRRNPSSARRELRRRVRGPRRSGGSFVGASVTPR